MKDKLTSLAGILVIISLMTIGWILFTQINNVQYQIRTDLFRVWFWDQRVLDIIVQITLMFAGALGISAILPSEETHD